MTRTSMDITSKPRQHRIRAALTAALLPVLAAVFVLGAISPAEAAKTRKATTRIVEPTSVTVASTTCTDLGDGTWNVTANFLVSGGQYLNLGSAEDVMAAPSSGRDNVRGGNRIISATTHYLNFPGYADDHTVAVTDTFTYQHLVAPITGKHKPVLDRTQRLWSRDFEVTFTCA